MIKMNKLLMSAVIMTAVVIKAEEVSKSDVVEQENKTYTELKKIFKSVTSQENIDMAKGYIDQGLEQTENSFKQYQMYVPAAFFFGRASMAAKAIRKAMHSENLPKNVLKTLKRVKNRNVYAGTGLLAGHLYCNRNEIFVQAKK